MFDKLPNKVYVSAIPRGLLFSWSRKGIGIGQLCIQANKKGKLEIDDECMNDEFALSIIKQAFKEKIK
jgi:hypothetical protein